MNVLSSNEAVEKLVSWRRSHTSLRLTLVSAVTEIAGSELVSIFEVDEVHHTVELTTGAGGAKAYGFSLDAAFITGDEESLEITFAGLRYILVRLPTN